VAGSRSVFGGEGGLADETRQVEGTGKSIADVLGLCAVLQAKPGRAFQVSSGLVGIAAFGVIEPTDAQLPGGRADLQGSGQAEVVCSWEGSP